nr:hypothetical protein [Variovorax sp. dw_308]
MSWCLVPVVAAHVPGDELLVVVDAHPIWVGFERHALTRVGRGDGVLVGLQHDAELARGTHGGGARHVVRPRVQRLQASELLLGKHLLRHAVRGAVDAHVGHRLQPRLGVRVEGGQIAQFQPVEQVYLYVADSSFDASFLMTLSDVARRDLEAAVPGEVDVARVEHRRLAHQAAQHSRAKVIDDHAPRATTERGEGVQVRAEEVLHLLRGEELHVHHAAVAQHHHEEAQAPTRAAHADGAVLAPVAYSGERDRRFRLIVTGRHAC